MSKLKISRRSILRGMGAAGIAVALPPLEAMFDHHKKESGRAHAQALMSPKRLVIFHWPNGCHPPEFIPTKTGTSWWGSDASPSLPVSLQPLQPHLKDINILSGISNIRSSWGGTGDGHMRASCSYLTSTLAGSDSGSAVGAAQSFDVLAGEILGQTTKIKRLHSALAYSGGDSYGLSWQALGQRLVALVNPLDLYNALFSGFSADPSQANKLKTKKLSILNAVREDAKDLQKKLGAQDRKRVDEHLNALSEIERSLGFGVSAGCVVPAMPANSPVPDGTSNPPQAVPFPGASDRAKLMMRLTYLGLVCDLTRVAFFSLGTSNNMRQYEGANYDDGSPIIGADHEISHYLHDPGNAANQKAQTWLTRWKMENLSYFLDLLKQKDGMGQSVLTSSAFYAGSEFSNGDWHSTEGLCGIAAGQVSTMTTGNHITFPCGEYTPPGSKVEGFPGGNLNGSCNQSGQVTPLASVWRSMLKAVGADDSRYTRDNAQVLSGLWG